MINKNYTRKKLYISRICLVCSRNSGLFLSLLSDKLLCRRKQRVCVYVEKTILRYGNVTGFFVVSDFLNDSVACHFMYKINDSPLDFLPAFTIHIFHVFSLQ